MGAYPPQGWIGTAVHLHSGAAFPPAPAAGDCFYRTDLNEFYIWNGVAWVQWEIEAHEAEHVLGGADAIDSGLNALAIALTTQGDIVYRAAAANTLARLAAGVAGQSLLTGGAGANPSWGAPAPAGHEATHVLGGADAIDSALDARAVALANQGDIVYRALAANTLAALAPGVAGQALLTGGAGANPSWGAPAPAAHAIDGVLHTAAGLTIGHTIRATGAAAFAFAQLQHADLGGVTSDLHHTEDHAARHKDGGADELDVSELAGAIGSVGEIPETDGAAVSWVDPDGRYDPKAHESSHVKGGADDIDAALDARAIALANQGEIVYHAAAANTLAALGTGTAGQALLTGGAAANPSWGAPAPAAHVLATTGPHTNTLPLTDLEVGVRGNIIHRGVADWAALAVGAAGQALLSGGAGADVLWGAPAPAAHASSHESGGADETRDMELDTGLANLTASGLKSLVTVGEIVLAGDGLFLYSDGKYYKSDASAAATMPVKVMALAGAAADATVLVLHEGYYRNDALYNWTPGAGVANLLYADVNAGLFVQFAGKPAGAGDQVQVCGWIVNANQIYFRPSLELVEIAA